MSLLPACRDFRSRGPGGSSATRYAPTRPARYARRLLGRGGQLVRARPAEVLDRYVLRAAHEYGDDELFVTAVLVQYHPGGGHCEVVNRGHLAPMLLTPAGFTPAD
ncbi:SpoIIE family protein phosphatase [Kitasatospora sp. GP82]|uniref:SpoIIE family protein phosphatase n=1 Tax=Kitasatospora sp. GP82 TaxID=3035089 RepID=UPI0024744D80|nr:SpoIIE family protein phosphatase [Kitasatospora sp. GP82]MDH6129318.1 serine phosphatase RsbU (regulator of sigma subunit) [Kitasatospora sp. GP82]